MLGQSQLGEITSTFQLFPFSCFYFYASTYRPRLWNSLCLLIHSGRLSYLFPNHQRYQYKWIFPKCPIIGFRMQVPYRNKLSLWLGSSSGHSRQEASILLCLSYGELSFLFPTSAYRCLFLYFRFIPFYLLFLLLALSILGTQCSKCGARVRSIGIIWERQNLGPHPRPAHSESTVEQSSQVTYRHIELEEHCSKGAPQWLGRYCVPADLHSNLCILSSASTIPALWSNSGDWKAKNSYLQPPFQLILDPCVSLDQMRCMQNLLCCFASSFPLGTPLMLRGVSPVAKNGRDWRSLFSPAIYELLNQPWLPTPRLLGAWNKHIPIWVNYNQRLPRRG